MSPSRRVGAPGDELRPSAWRYAVVVTRLRWVALALVVGAAWLATVQLPGLAGGGGGLSGLVGTDNPAVEAQLEAVEAFGLPLLSRTAVVQRDPAGLGPYTQARTVLRALEVNQRTLELGTRAREEILLALPLINYPVLVPGAAEAGTTAITYLFASPLANLSEQDLLAREYAARFDAPDADLVGVSGTIPLQVAQGALIAERLPLVEVGALVAVALIVGWSFRSVAAPLITLVTAVVAYLLTDRMIGWFAETVGFAAPAQLRPIVVALTLGIATDYTVFFLSGLQRRLRAGERNPRATRGAVAEYLPIVIAAGLTVGAGVATLIVAESGLFRAFGPGLAITVVVTLAVSVTLVPALLAIAGPWAFWPSPLGSPEHDGDEVPAGRRHSMFAVGVRLVRWVTHRWVAAVVTVLLLAGLVALTLPVLGLRATVSPMAALPAEHPVREAYEAAAAGFAEGVLAPTAVIVSGPAIVDRRAALQELQAEIATVPGVAMVLGPGDNPLPLEVGLFLAPGGDAARYLVVLDSDPLGTEAIDTLRALQDRMPALLADAGLAGAGASYAGDTALGLSLVDTAESDLLRVAVAVILVDLALLVLFLRALVAPVYLMAASVLGVGAALGLTTWFFQDVLGAGGLIFYVPFAAAVLLVSLGADYNIFGVGYVWEEARRRPLDEALRVAIPRSSRAINIAGLTLAVSFAFVALIPVAPFRQLAFAVAVGVLIDAFVLRALLVPALVALVGRASGWPGRRLRLDS